MLSNLRTRLDAKPLIAALAPLLLALATATVTVAYYEVHGPTLHTLMLLSLVWLYLQSRRGAPLAIDRLTYVLSGIFLFYTLIAILSAGRTGFNTDALDRLEHFSYFLAGVFLIPFLVAIRVRPVWFWPAIALTALFSGLYAFWEMQFLSAAFERTYGIDYRAAGSKGKQIPFGDIAALAAVLSALGACVMFDSRRLWSVLLFGAAIFGLYASIASGTRGAWLVFPTALVVIGVYLLRQYPTHRRGIFIALTALLVVGGLGVLQSEQIRTRIAVAVSEARSYSPGVVVRSGDALGERFEMWRAARMAYQEHPWLGIGVGQLNAYFKQAADHQLISPAIIAFNNSEGHTHAHNDYIHALATRGLLGLTSLLLLYLVPLGVFARTAITGTGAEQRALGYAGILTMLAYMQFSLTDSILLMRITAGFFVLLCCWLLALCLSQTETTSP